MPQRSVPEGYPAGLITGRQARAVGREGERTDLVVLYVVAGPSGPYDAVVVHDELAARW